MRNGQQESEAVILMGFFEQYENDMISYVKNRLETYDAAENPILKLRHSRFEHTMRVYKWIQTLYAAYPDREHLDSEALSIAAIFHDVGYGDVENIQNHAETSAICCREYLESKEYPPEKTDFVCDLIRRHSSKGLLHEDIPGELILLLEADLLDDSGAQGLVLDIWLEARKKDASFQSILNHMEKYTLAMMQNNPMRTAEGIRIWNEKKRLSEAFVQAYKEDILF